MKKQFLLPLILLFLLVCGCNAKQHTPDETATNVPLTTLMEKMSNRATSLPTMDTLSKNDADAQEWFEYLCDLDYNKVEDFLISYSNQTTADEIFLIHLKDKNDVALTELSLQHRIDTRLLAFQNYLPIQVNKMNQAVVTSIGSYVALIICNNPDDVEDTFQETLSTP